MKKNFFQLALISCLALFALTATAHPVQPVETTDAPKPLGAYSQGMIADLSQGKLLFIAGQVALDPKTGKLLEDDIHTATQRTMENIGAILKAAGSDWKYVLHTDVMLKNFDRDWDGMNEEYAKYFSNKVFPSRKSFETNIENRIEISAIAYIPNKK